MSNGRMTRISKQLALSTKLSDATSFYGTKLEVLRQAWASRPFDKLAERRYMRLSARWHREAARLIQKADEMLVLTDALA